MTTRLALDVCGRSNTTSCTGKVKMAGRYKMLVCPSCFSLPSSMTLHEIRHDVTAQDVMKRPHLASVGRDVFMCKCGNRMTWFDMIELHILEFVPNGGGGLDVEEETIWQ